MDIPETLADKIALYKSSGRLFRDNMELFSEISWFSVLNGQGILPDSYHPLADSIPDDELAVLLSKIKQAIQAGKAQMPLHDEFIRKNCGA